MSRAPFDFSRLSIAERIQLAEDLWDSIPEEEVDVPLTEAQKAELDRRLEDLERNPDAGESWGVVRARLYERLRLRLRRRHWMSASRRFSKPRPLSASLQASSQGAPPAVSLCRLFRLDSDRDPSRRLHAREERSAAMATPG